MAKKKEQSQNQEQGQEQKRKPGRPFGTLKYDNLEDLETGINKYFDDCDANGEPYRMTGLALALNVDLKTLSNYSRIENYFPIINRARHKCLDYNFGRLYDKDGFHGAKMVIINDAERMVGVRYADRQEVSMDVAPITFIDNLE